MTGKEKCEFLREIRKNMAEANGIPYEPRECNYEGECSGTCPFCEKEAANLLAALKEKKFQGVEIKTDQYSTMLLNKDIDAKSLQKLQEEEITQIHEEQMRPLMGDIPSPYVEELRKKWKEEICQEEKQRLTDPETIGVVQFDCDEKVIRKRQREEMKRLIEEQNRHLMGDIDDELFRKAREEKPFLDLLFGSSLKGKVEF